ncbi:hypothetical protein FACS1894208_08010 [Clostridia bacterium]|nr:hypothetical protein FACS1894208_08010 [Clostridia bacterium]
MEMVITGINTFLKSVGDVTQSAFDLLPGCPFSWTFDLDNEVLRFINWLIPVGEMMGIAAGWLVCIGIWYGASILLRWLKVAQG